MFKVESRYSFPVWKMGIRCYLRVFEMESVEYMQERADAILVSGSKTTGANCVYSRPTADRSWQAVLLCNRIVATGAECSSSVVLFLHYNFWCLVTANVLYKYV